MSSRAYVVSDIHLGNDHCYADEFLAWLDGLPEHASLILNGDVVDDQEEVLQGDHEKVLQRLIAESGRRPVIWVRGNHDSEFALADSGDIRFETRWEIGESLLIMHGHELDGVMPRHGLFKALFRLMHRFLVGIGFPDVHVASFAKKWGLLYRVLSDHVAHKAMRMAAASGHRAVTCGHTHAAMEVERDGVRYMNTGAWTEEPLYYLTISDGHIGLNIFPNGTS